MANSTSRRNLLRSAALGGLATGLGITALPGAARAAGTGVAGLNNAQNRGSESGPLVQATVAFGAWQGDQGWDRMDPGFDPISANHHSVAPREVKIRAGGSVNYAIGGFHQINIYDDGVRPEQIDTSNLIVSTGPNAPPFPILIDEPVNRIYRGLDPGGEPLDRVESVQFSEPGTYLVICCVIFHFVNDDMFGFVRVLP